MIRIEYKKKYLVTGGSGFLGGELITRILDHGGEVVTVARNEGQLIKLKQMFQSFLFHQHLLPMQLWKQQKQVLRS